MAHEPLSHRNPIKPQQVADHMSALRMVRSANVPSAMWEGRIVLTGGQDIRGTQPTTCRRSVSQGDCEVISAHLTEIRQPAHLEMRD